MNTRFKIDRFSVGPSEPLLLIAGPCVLEDAHINDEIARTLRDVCQTLNLNYIFKASYDKANRSSYRSSRGPGLDAGLEELRRIGQTFDIPVTTDLHEPAQAAAAAEVVDVLQVPAFLVRQTDLLIACAQTGKPVNAKKGQFMAPAEMKHVIGKLREGGCDQIMLTERGTFFGYHRLVNDFIGLGDMMQFDVPVCFDVTHSTQLPGGGDGVTSGRPERAGLLARAAVAAGVNAVFIECHPQPDKARSDASTMQALDAMPALLEELSAVYSIVQQPRQAAAAPRGV